MSNLVEQVIVDILSKQLPLDDQRIWIREQTRSVPNDTGLYVVVGFVNSPTVISSVTDVIYVPQPDTDPVIYDVKEIGQVIMREDIQVDVGSRDNSAVQRHWEIIAALHSIYCQQKQEENYFKIFRLPNSFANTSGPEGGSNLNRFSLVFSVQVMYRKENTLSGYDYYDDFKTRVDDEKSIGTEHGIIEFEIIGDSILGG